MHDVPCFHHSWLKVLLIIAKAPQEDLALMALEQQPTCTLEQESVSPGRLSTIVRPNSDLVGLCAAQVPRPCQCG